MNTIRSIAVVLALVLAAAVGFTEQKPREVRPLDFIQFEYRNFQGYCVPENRRMFVVETVTTRYLSA